MNIYALIIVFTLIGAYLLELIADTLNLRALNPELPDEFQGVYDQPTYGRSQEYTRVRTRFGLITATFDLAVLLFFWHSGGFNWLDMLVRSWQTGPLWTGVVYIGLLGISKAVIDLPFAVYSTFVIEEKFGFNRTTPALFLADMVKGLALAVVLGGPLLAVVLYLFQTAGQGAWLYCWLTAAAFIVVMQYVAPVWIMPLFNKFSPLADGDLKTAIMDYAASVAFSLADVFVIDGSKRSSKANAFFTGFGKNKRIALFDTLIAKHDNDELLAILAHEIGHYQKKHIRQGMVISILHMGVIFFLLSLFISRAGLFEAFYMQNPSIYAGLIFFSLLFTPLEIFLSLFMQMLSRHNEFAADRFARETTGQGETLVKALKKLAGDNLANLTPHPFYVFLHYSHPPLMQRIAALRASDSQSVSACN